MLKPALAACRRLHTTTLLCVLRFRKAEAEWVATQIEADVLAAPRQLADLRARIAYFDERVRRLEGMP
ncbi:MAG: hypothetical protein EOP38_20460 [Rubrivivax sp.]|nr:MAG: hypothetical protein EOP38_20460 [Rubrivivax sp.]